MHLLKQAHFCGKDEGAVGKQHDYVPCLDKELHCEGFHSEERSYRQQNKCPNLPLDQKNVQNYFCGVFHWHLLAEGDEQAWLRQAKKPCVRTKRTAFEEQGGEKDVEDAKAEYTVTWK